MKHTCLVCNTAADAVDYGAGADTICPRCGSFKINGIASEEMFLWSHQQRVNLSGWIREHQGCEIVVSDIPRLASLKTPPVGEKAEKILLRLSTAFPKPGGQVSFDAKLSDELLGRASAFDKAELNFLLKEYLTDEKAYLRVDGGSQKITPKGWAHLDALTQVNVSSSQGFIAMWFADSMNETWKAIERGIESAGYKPHRIDQAQHNNKIDDEIIAAIRRSKFVVADFTGQRGGVYFEAGFGLGLGLQVIWLCRRDHLKKVHFDNRQYNFIRWSNDKLDELERTLKNRIEATIGPGPLKPLDQP